jgi:hypothetical protein
VLQKRINKAIAAANPTMPYSQVAARVSQVISVALQRAAAYNALDFRYTKLAKGRVVGGSSGAGNAVVARQLLAQLTNDWDADDDEEPEAQPLAAVAAACVSKWAQNPVRHTTRVKKCAYDSGGVWHAQQCARRPLSRWCRRTPRETGQEAPHGTGGTVRDG